MKKLALGLLLLWGLAACAGGMTGGSGAGDVVGGPSVYCKVVKAPNPALMGNWKCLHNRFIAKTGHYEPDPIEYRLVKVGDNYGLFFRRVKEGGDKELSGWRAWTINGDEIKSDTGVRIFTKDGDVFFSWKGDGPTKMSRSGSGG